MNEPRQYANAITLLDEPGNCVIAESVPGLNGVIRIRVIAGDVTASAILDRQQVWELAQFLETPIGDRSDWKELVR